MYEKTGTLVSHIYAKGNVIILAEMSVFTQINMRAYITTTINTFNKSISVLQYTSSCLKNKLNILYLMEPLPNGMNVYLSPRFRVLTF